MSSTTEGRPARTLIVTGVATLALTVTAALGVFLVAPEDVDQGIIQKIFYFHVAIAIAALVAFAVAAVAGVRYLRSRQERHDAVAAASIGIGLAFSVVVVITGSIWGRASWGTWWVWNDPRLVTFLIVILLYSAYWVLRSAFEHEGERRARFSAIYAIAAFASVPLSFYSVRIAESFVHPVVFTPNGANMPNSMLVWFVVSQAAALGLYLTALQLQLVQGRAQAALARVRLAIEAPG